MSLSLALGSLDAEEIRRRQGRPVPDPVKADVKGVLALAAERAESLDHLGAFPKEELIQLVSLAARMRTTGQGGSFDCEAVPSAVAALRQFLTAIGYASLPVGRLFEGHVNALGLVGRYGTAEQAHKAAAEAAEGHIFGVWNTERADGLSLYPSGGGYTLKGAKIFASGAGFITRPLVTARLPGGESLMVLPRIPEDELSARADLARWTATGMRASATGSFDFSGLHVTRDDIIGGPEDYQRQPMFSAGAWRFLAVQLGGMERLLDEACSHLKSLARHEDPHQLARIGEATIAVESARLWVCRAAERAEISPDEGAVAYVNLARCAVERAGLDVLEHVNRSVGLSGFLAPHPIERVSRDLATYLRQPGPDRALTAGAQYLLASARPFRETWS